MVNFTPSLFKIVLSRPTVAKHVRAVFWQHLFQVLQAKKCFLLGPLDGMTMHICTFCTHVITFLYFSRPTSKAFDTNFASAVPLQSWTMLL